MAGCGLSKIQFADTAFNRQDFSKRRGSNNWRELESNIGLNIFSNDAESSDF
jgi:hypothetical protein